jgi:hypothetical protein
MVELLFRAAIWRVILQAHIQRQFQTKFKLMNKKTKQTGNNK